NADDFLRQLEQRAEALAAGPDLVSRLADKRRRRQAEERARPLASYRARELAHMADNFFGPDPAYHEARRSFVFRSAVTPPRDRAQEPASRRGEEYSVADGYAAVRAAAGSRG